MNAWGAPGGGERSGIYYEFCQDHGVEYFDFRAASRFGDERQFEGACGFALQNATSLVPKYDAILVDEAQDLPPTFLTLCYEYLKSPKRLVYAYDELQSLGRPPLPPVEELFGKDIDGKPRVVIQPDQPGKPKQDIILDTCYRNSRPVLSTAHALGFGVYRQEGLAQIFENKSLWLDIGYSVVAGDLDDGMHVSLARTQQSSPEFLEKHSPLDDLIRFKVFDSAEEQTKWLVKQINLNINQDELLPDDIVVINTDPLSTRSAVSTARASLLEKGINSVLAGVSTSPDVFSEPGQVTFTGIFRAKGNEAAMVYIINAQDCYTAPQRRQVARIRSRLFTAITRSKAWVRVLGIGPEMTSLKSEFEAIAAANFELRFKYPTIDERKKMMIVNRELSKSAEERVNKKRASLIEAVASLESGETFLEDYPEEIIRRLQNIIDKKLR